MEFRGVHHVSLNVTDVEVATRFYTEVLGLDLLERPDFSFPGAWLAAGSQQIHLLGVDEFEAPEGQHFALQVDDIDATVLTPAERGAATSPPREVAGVCRQAFLRDPAGNLIELNQPLT